VLLGAGAAAFVASTDPPQLLMSGVADGQRLLRQDVRVLRVEVEATDARAVSFSVDGAAAEAARDGDRYVLDLSSLGDGEHVVEVSADGRLPWHETSLSRRFTVDLSGPTLHVPERLGIVTAGEPLELKGTVSDAVEVTMNGLPVQIDRGKVTVLVPGLPGTVTVRAVAANGAAEERVVEITDQDVPPRVAPMRAVHITSEDWADEAKREAVLSLARWQLIDTVQLDIKGESGEVGYLSGVPLARQIGAVRDHYDPATTLGELHAMGLRVVGRIVNFRDPLLGPWARDNGRLDWLVLDGAGTAPYASEYGDAAFVNMANPDVQQYSIDLATEAAALGFDSILYDYVRRPDGDISTMSFPGITTRTEVAVAEFVRRTHDALEAAGDADVDLGLSVFGIAATRPNQIAQDMPLLLPWVDYVAPMVYPSLWNDGEYGVADPAAQPYDIVERSVTDFVDHARATGVAVIPWLQAFSLTGDPTYGPDMVDAQIRAAAAAGGQGFLLWNASSVYDSGGLIPSAAGRAAG
jgi:hypothetical protein